MRLLHTLLLILLLASNTLANYLNHYDRQTFIETFATMATNEMHRTGIPASITLAQAILESSWGQGKIAVEGNNFFGIKCYNDWAGPCIKAMDDEVDSSSFRFYRSVEESFKDHSDFLKTNVRYQQLFEIPATDYRKWAHGLKSCGYATDELYAEKLIRIVEENGLFLYDYAAAGFRVLDTKAEIGTETETEGPQTLPLEQDDFRVLETAPVEGQSEVPVMPAPVYRISAENWPSNPHRLENSRPDGSPAAAPLIPLPENILERR